MNRKEIEGYEMLLDPCDGGISRTLLKKGKREECFMYLLRKQKGTLAFDVGGNIGYTTLSLCNQFDYVHAFEPDDRSRKLLISNININNFGDKCTIDKRVIYDRDGEIGFAKASKPNLSKVGGNDMMVCTKIDSLGIIPDFIKCDIEGSETALIQGARKTLEKGNVKLLIEVHPTFYNKENNFRTQLEWLATIGYKITYVVSAGVPMPILFANNGYEPCKELGGRRAIYKGIRQKHAIDWCSRSIGQMQPNGKVSPKIIRSILIERC